MVDYENSDDIELTTNCYLKDVENKFHPFEGTWVWSNGTDTLTVMIEKIEMVYIPNSNYYSDFLIGKYKYIQNGNEITNTLNYNITSSNMWNNSHVPMYDQGYFSDTKIIFTFMDYTKQKKCNLRLTLIDFLNDLDGNIVATKAQWELYDEEKSHIVPVDPNSVGFSVPNNVELIKNREDEAS